MEADEAMFFFKNFFKVDNCYLFSPDSDVQVHALTRSVEDTKGVWWVSLDDNGCHPISEKWACIQKHVHENSEHGVSDEEVEDLKFLFRRMYLRSGTDHVPQAHGIGKGHWAANLPFIWDFYHDIENDWRESKYREVNVEPNGFSWEDEDDDIGTLIYVYIILKKRVSIFPQVRDVIGNRALSELIRAKLKKHSTLSEAVDSLISEIRNIQGMTCFTLGDEVKVCPSRAAFIMFNKRLSAIDRLHEELMSGIQTVDRQYLISKGGYKINKGRMVIDWLTETGRDRVRKCHGALCLRGCKTCKTGCCKNCCICFANCEKCGVFCKCFPCENPHNSKTPLADGLKIGACLKISQRTTELLCKQIDGVQFATEEMIDKTKYCSRTVSEKFYSRIFLFSPKEIVFLRKLLCIESVAS